MILYGDSVARKDAAGNVIIDRVLRTKPHPTYEAGDRTGRLPEVLPLNYEAFVAAFQSTNSVNALSHTPGKGSAVNSPTPGNTQSGKVTKQ
jgi:hypothetical protein